jgi:peptide/nickel transport system substrate-binding protein
MGLGRRARIETRGGASAVAVLLLVAVLASSCTRKTESANSAGPSATVNAADRDRAAGTPKPGGGLSVGLVAETNSYVPAAGQWSTSGYLVANAIFDPLVAMDDQGIAKPYLAESLLPTGDFLHWTIKLRAGVIFQDGSALNSAAVKKNLDAVRGSALLSLALGAIASVDTPDERTVVVNMNRPWATFPATLALQPGYMAAPAMLDDPAGANATPIGTGPFEYNDRQIDSFFKMKRNPNYWRKDAQGVQLPYLDAVEFKVITEPTARVASLNAGSVDAIEATSFDSYAAEEQAAKAGQVQVIDNTKTETDEQWPTASTKPTSPTSPTTPPSPEHGACSKNTRPTTSHASKRATPPTTSPKPVSSPISTGRHTGSR